MSTDPTFHAELLHLTEGVDVLSTLIHAVGADEVAALFEDDADHTVDIDVATSAGMDPEDVTDYADIWREQMRHTRKLGVGEADVETMTRLGARLIIPSDQEWPVRLSSLGGHEPIALWAMGPANLAAAAADSVTITGARAHTAYGQAIANDLGYTLTREGFTVVTTGGFGVDGDATRGSLASGDTPPIVVQASGLDRFHPSAHHNLLESVAEKGVVVTTAVPGALPQRSRFIARSGLIAALSAGTVVVEAGMRSGALAVAHQAQGLGRFVGAVPGPITSAASNGTNNLLKTGAVTVVTDAQDVITALRG